MNTLPSLVHLTLPEWIFHDVDTARLYASDEDRIALAIRLANRNVEEKTGGPFGAAVFTREGRLISVGVNRVVPQHCSVAHAEMMAYMLAQSKLGRFRLNEAAADGTREQYVLATSAQPCCQCYGATIWAGIDELLIGARSQDVEELSEFDEGPLPADWIGELGKRGVQVRRDILREAAREVFVRYRASGGANY
ncbi:MAG: nucleoside deaminase [Proteobacteria bacterium]|nr:nucleoside deaminase [Pseudomonadota bacterium]